MSYSTEPLGVAAWCALPLLVTCYCAWKCLRTPQQDAAFLECGRSDTVPRTRAERSDWARDAPQPIAPFTRDAATQTQTSTKREKKTSNVPGAKTDRALADADQARVREDPSTHRCEGRKAAQNGPRQASRDGPAMRQIREKPQKTTPESGRPRIHVSSGCRFDAHVVEKMARERAKTGQMQGWITGNMQKSRHQGDTSGSRESFKRSMPSKNIHQCRVEAEARRVHAQDHQTTHRQLDVTCTPPAQRQQYPGARPLRSSQEGQGAASAWEESEAAGMQSSFPTTLDLTPSQARILRHRRHLLWQGTDLESPHQHPPTSAAATVSAQQMRDKMNSRY